MLTIDEASGQVTIATQDGGCEVHPMGSAKAFAAVSAAWLRCGWDVKYVYGFTWMGRPIIQLPEDMIRIQELIWRLEPDVVIETGVAHGGSLVFYAGLLKAIGHGRVIGIDIDIRSANRAAIERHRLAPAITLIEAGSTLPATRDAVASLLAPGERVLVILDSNHSRDHVADELRLYGPLVSAGSYIVACDGIMARLAGAPRSQPDWVWNNPVSAVQDFIAASGDFVLEEPEFPFNEGLVRDRVTYWPRCFLRRLGG